MKLITRLLLTCPFVIVTFLYLKLNLADNGCWGLIELIYTVILWILLVITFILSLIATLRKRQSEHLKVEKYSLAVLLLTLITLIVGGVWGNNFKGSVLIEAKRKDYSNHHSNQDLILRKNGKFTVYLGEDDFVCYYTGNYKKINDTLIFDEKTIAKTESKMTTLYLINGVMDNCGGKN